MKKKLFCNKGKGNSLSIYYQEMKQNRHIFCVSFTCAFLFFREWILFCVYRSTSWTYSRLDLSAGLVSWTCQLDLSGCTDGDKRSLGQHQIPVLTETM